MPPRMQIATFNTGTCTDQQLEAFRTNDNKYELDAKQLDNDPAGFPRFFAESEIAGPMPRLKCIIAKTFSAQSIPAP